MHTYCTLVHALAHSLSLNTEIDATNVGEANRRKGTIDYNLLLNVMQKTIKEFECSDSALKPKINKSAISCLLEEYRSDIQRLNELRNNPHIGISKPSDENIDRSFHMRYSDPTEQREAQNPFHEFLVERKEAENPFHIQLELGGENRISEIPTLPAIVGAKKWF